MSKARKDWNCVLVQPRRCSDLYDSSSDLGLQDPPSECFFSSFLLPFEFRARNPPFVPKRRLTWCFLPLAGALTVKVGSLDFFSSF